MKVKPFSKCRYSAFFSYAHADDDGDRNWITHFEYELRRGLESRLGGTVPPIHMSRKNGPVRGFLDEALRSNVRDSFWMFLFVHHKYVDSGWCLAELNNFKEIFGDEGFRKRLIIIAMSTSSMDRLRRDPRIKPLFPNPDQVWMEFCTDDEPLAIYSTITSGSKAPIVTNEFWTPFNNLRNSLIAEAKQSDESTLVPFPESADTLRAPVAEHQDVRIYVESSEGMEQYQEALGRQVVASWEQVTALDPVEPPLYLRPTGLPMSDIDDRPLLDDADGVVLLWCNKTPDSLAVQIAQVEPKLSGPDYAPGLLAYVMSSPQDKPVSRQINYWPVVRFASRDSGMTVLADDAPLLTRFLREVLARKRKRRDVARLMTG